MISDDVILSEAIRLVQDGVCKPSERAPETTLHA